MNRRILSVCAKWNDERRQNVLMWLFSCVYWKHQKPSVNRNVKNDQTEYFSLIFFLFLINWKFVCAFRNPMVLCDSLKIVNVSTIFWFLFQFISNDYCEYQFNQFISLIDCDVIALFGFRNEKMFWTDVQLNIFQFRNRLAPLRKRQKISWTTNEMCEKVKKKFVWWLGQETR